MGQSIRHDGNAIPLLSNDMVSQQAFVQTQNENALGSYNSPHLENHFRYFSYLHDDDDDDHDDDNAQTAYKRANLKLKEFSKCPPPLGLRLTKTPILLQFTEEKLNGAAESITPCQSPAKKVEKLKAVHFPMLLLMIGSFMIKAKYAADLVVKCYYAKRKLVWEILRNGLKKKIEIQWQNILAFRAVIEENKPGTLEIELDRVPSFFREIAPKPQKHTVWVPSEDFTAGQASEYRRHYLQFPPGVLDQHYVKLLQCDNRLLELSQKPFPSLYSPYFDSHLDKGTTHFLFGHDQHLHGSKTTLASVQQPTLELPVVSTQQVQLFGNTMPLSLIANNDPTSDICSPTNEAITNQMLQDQQLASWSQGLNYETSTEYVPCASYLQQNGPGSNYELFSHINKMLLTGYYIPEIVFDKRHMGNVINKSTSAIANLSMEAGLVYNTNTSTQIDRPNNTSGNSWNALANGSGEEYYASNANLNPMHGDPFVNQRCLFYPEQLITSPPEVCNESSFVDPCTRHFTTSYITTPKWSRRGHDYHDYHG